MALFKIFKGQDSGQLTNPSADGYRQPTDGYAYYDTGTGLFYIDANYDSAHPNVISRQPINADNARTSDLSAISMKSVKVPYVSNGTGTAAVTTSGSYYHAKWEATLPGITTLEDGLFFVYKVPVAGQGTCGNGLNVNSLGYHPVVSQVTSKTGTRYAVGANILLVYDSSLIGQLYINNVSTDIQGCWVVVNDYDSGNTIPSAYCSSGASTQAKTASCSGYVLLPNSFIHVIITTTNTVKNKLTLNINSQGAKNIYLNGVVTSSTNYNLKAGSYLVYYDGTNYYFRDDGKITGSITGNAATADKATKDSDGNDINTTYIKKSTLSSAYDIMYSSAANTPTRLAANTATTRKFLRMAGTGSAGTAPAWDTVTKSDVGLGNVENKSSSTIRGELTSSNVTTALGYTPYNSTNPNGYTTNTGTVTGITAGAGLNTTNNDTATDGGTISTSGTLYLTKSGVTANTYGNTSQQTPSHGGTFNIPYFTVDKYGRITSANTTTVKLPTDNNTDTKVTQTTTATNADYRILLSGSANDTTTTEETNKNTNLRFNPGAQLLSVGGSISATGDLTVTGVTSLNGQTYTDNLTAGSLIVNGNTNFVQIPTAPTPANNSNDTSVATTAFVMNAFTANDAMVFKGVVNANGDLPTIHKQGWTYRVATAGTYAGKVCEVGDMIVCVTDGTAAADAHWAVIQNNVDGAVYRGTNLFTDANIIIADSTAGKVKSSGKTITNTAPSASSTSATIPSSTAVWAAISGASGYGKTGTVTSVQVQATAPIVSSNSASTSTSLSTTISLAATSANYVIAGPSTGTATAVPTYRKLVAADIPSLTKSKISDFPTNVSAFTNDSGYLTSFTETDPTVPSWAKASSKPSYTASEVGLGNVTNAAQITKATFTKAYQVMYSTAANTPAVLDANTTTTRKFLRMTGTGSAGAAPAWDTVTKSDVGLGNVENTKLSTWAGSSNITTIGTLSSGTVPWARLSGVPSSFTPASHTHGNLTNDGKISTTATIASGDKLVIVDSDSTAANKITGSSITFGTSANYALANDGTWQEFNNYAVEVVRLI